MFSFGVKQPVNHIIYYTLMIIIPCINTIYKKFWKFCGKFADEGDNPVNNPNKNNVEGDNPVDNPNKCNIEGDNKLSSRRRELF
jgi:hypothetical protein